LLWKQAGLTAKVLQNSQMEIYSMSESFNVGKYKEPWVFPEARSMTKVWPFWYSILHSWAHGSSRWAGAGQQRACAAYPSDAPATPAE